MAFSSIQWALNVKRTVSQLARLTIKVLQSQVYQEFRYRFRRQTLPPRRGCFSGWYALRVGFPFILCLGLMLICGITGIAWSAQPTPAKLTLTVHDEVVGVSTQYIGACEGNVNFDLADLTDLGLNTYRIYGGMARWETSDDDGVYGYPTIAQIKADPGRVNWDWWDTAMTHPKGGSDYAFSGNPVELWQGNARTLFETLKQAQIRPVLTLRNVDSNWNPDWALQLNPPRTAGDWNEWWEHVFATVYWLNVRNDYRVDDFEIHNEPDNREQGWGGNQQDYFELVRVAKDAIAHVYETYLPDRSYHIHAPKTTGGSSWPTQALATIPKEFDQINIHNYERDISDYVRQVREWMQGTIHENSPLWLGEWGTYTGGYDDLGFSLDLVKNMLQISRPGPTHVEGSHLFALYDWGNDLEGLVTADGRRRLSYYAFRLGIRALQGGREVLRVNGSYPKAMSLATRNPQGQIFLLVVNDHATAYTFEVNLDIPRTFTKREVWEFSQTVLDEQVEAIASTKKTFTLSIPAHSSRLIVMD